MFSTVAITPPKAPKHLAEEGFRQALKWSLIAHVVFLVIVILKSLIFPSTAKPYVPTLRVDMVALPDALKKDLQNHPATQSSKEIAEALKRAEVEAKKIKAIKVPEQAAPDEMVLHPK